MTIKECIKKYSHELKNITHIPNKEVEILILYLLNKNVIWLHLNDNQEFKKEDQLKKLVAKRASHYPIEYLINKASFYGENFIVKENVLIPRPETELLIDHALEILKKLDSPKVVEVGTGSGVISVMLAKLIPNIQITALDINDDALSLAKENAQKHEVSEKITFIHSDLFGSLKDDDFDMCISNPPYIADDYQLPKNVKYEPSNALFGGKKGDELLQKLIQQVYAKNISYLLCEFGYDQKEPTKEYFKKFKIKSLNFYQDYEKFDRGFIAHIK